MSKFTVTKFPNGSIHIAGPVTYVGKLPPPSDSKNDPEIKEMLEFAFSLIEAEAAKKP